jgi:transcriptional regulator with XRE-family HTH domain
MIREREGLTIADLCRLADVAVISISEFEKRRRNLSNVLKNRILRGLNENPRRSREFEFAEIFPDPLNPSREK